MASAPIALTLNGTGISNGGALHSTGGNNSDAGAITLGSSTLINSEVAGNTLTLTGGIIGGGFALTIGGSGNTDHASAAGITGISSLTKNDDGVLTLAAADSYTGPTLMNAGTIILCKTPAQPWAALRASPWSRGAALDLQN